MQLVRLWDGNRFCAAIAGEPGRKYIHAIVMTDSGVKVIDLPKEDQPQVGAKCPPGIRGGLMRRGKAYPIERACRIMLAAGRRVGITKDAKRRLKEVLACSL